MQGNQIVTLFKICKMTIKYNKEKGEESLKCVRNGKVISEVVFLQDSTFDIDGPIKYDTYTETGKYIMDCYHNDRDNYSLEVSKETSLQIIKEAKELGLEVYKTI